MSNVDRRGLFRLALGFAAAAAVGTTLSPKTAEAALLPAAPAGEPAATETPVEQAHWTGRRHSHGYNRRRRYYRRRRCRRVCRRNRWGRVRCYRRCW